ncbi:trypsin-like peptidase domain-containing protein [Streptomyces sp. 5-8]|uniref:Trypsin-like peptidase domain-containing protein n=1 Tax=Streptomyces musisoli TaxID=2802280 RepID=A0ABS1NXE0_9ACTN|nr:trypsin-like peptidase domain-containing protein [Streptomyces musisoli]MBL1104777.1 trypsin-like peptidase domain-containing protein [Streptomyces musisoli]
MRSAAWHARIACGDEVGAGFLVAGRRVLTCAHVVRWSDSAAVTVTFPHARELGELSAAVVAHGGWSGGVTDPGDVAVLELDRDVPLAPAGFAPPDAAYTEPYPKLIAYGFPEGYDEGTLAEYQAVSGQLIAGEWLELVAWHGHGQPLAGGFSGAAATLPDGTVAGMVTAALDAPEMRKGRMLPLDVLARYWPELGELVPTPGHRADTRRRLYALLRRATADADGVCDPNRMYVDAVGPFGPPLPPGGFPSLWAAAGYVQWEVPDPQAVDRLTGRLGELLDGERGLRSPAPSAPAAAASPPASPAAPAPPAWSPVVVEIDHSGAGPDQVTVEVSAYRDGRRRPVGACRLPRTGVRSYVQGRIDEAVAHLAPDADELVTFVLPREWLNEAVAHWECGVDDSTPLGCAYPLVVTDRARHHSGRMRHQLRKKWQKLDAGGGAELHRVECGTQERPPSLRKRLWDGDAGLAGFAAPPTAVRRHFEIGLTVPVPVLLWRRSGSGCAAHGDASCPGAGPGDPPCTGTTFLDRLTASVAGVPPAELPRHVMSLRLTADADDEPDQHWARDLQVLWDDPRCFPETTASLHSPVA